MAIIRLLCPSCRMEIDVSVGQSVYGGELTWYEAYSCPYCKSQVEADGHGTPPDNIRRAVLQQEGEWTLTLAVTGTQVTKALKVLRQALALSLNEVQVLRKCIPGVVATGTKAEMDRLRELLSADGVRATIERRNAS